MFQIGLVYTEGEIASRVFKSTGDSGLTVTHCFLLAETSQFEYCFELVNRSDTPLLDKYRCICIGEIYENVS